MMQLKKRKQKEKKGLNVREIWVQLSQVWTHKEDWAEPDPLNSVGSVFSCC